MQKCIIELSVKLYLDDVPDNYEISDIVNELDYTFTSEVGLIVGTEIPDFRVLDCRNMLA